MNKRQEEILKIKKQREYIDYKRSLFNKLQIIQGDSVSVKGALYRLCGDMIGKGANRDVYVLRHDPNWVVKIQRSVKFDNIFEWEIWCALHETPYEKWLADCLSINETGIVMIQRRVWHRDMKEYPRFVPAFFSDLKIENYGWTSDDKFVCCDYTSIVTTLLNNMPLKRRIANWWTVSKKGIPSVDKLRTNSYLLSKNF